MFVYGTVKCGINSIGPQHQGFRFSMGDGGMAIHSTVCLYAVMGHSVTCHMSRLITAPRHSGAAPADGLAWSYTGQWSWNNGKEVPRWGVAEIQKMSPSTTDQSPSRNCISRPGVVIGTYLASVFPLFHASGPRTLSSDFPRRSQPHTLLTSASICCNWIILCAAITTAEPSQPSHVITDHYFPFRRNFPAIW